MVHRLRFLIAIFGLLFLSYQPATASPAPTLYTCPNVQVGVAGAVAVPAVYSDCYMDFTYLTGPRIITMFYNAGTTPATIEIEGAEKSFFVPQPSYSVSTGTYGEADALLENMGSGYSGNCVNDMDPTISRTTTDLPSNAGDVYCARVSNTAGESLWIRATFNGTTFTSPLAVTNAASAAPSVPVPTHPLLGLLSLGGLIGLFGIRKLKK